MFIPRLDEEEARYFVLRFLAQAPKGLGNVEDIREFVKTSRKFPSEDFIPNPTRSNAPFWHQIVQNATDRYIVQRGFAEQVSPPPNKTLKITDKGRFFIRAYIDFFDIHPGVDEFSFINVDVLSAMHDKIPKYFNFYKKEQFYSFIRSKNYAIKYFKELENRSIAEILLDKKKNKILKNEARDEKEEFHIGQLTMWRETRCDFSIPDLVSHELNTVT